MPTSIADREVLGRTLREHIGGRWAISWIAYVINIPVNLIGIASNVPDASNTQPATWLAIWALGYAALGGVLLIANATAFRSRCIAPVPISWVVILGALAGGARGFVVGILADVWAVSGGGTELIVTRTVTGALMGAVLIPGAALVLSLIDTSVNQRRALVDQLAHVEVERMRAEGESEALRQALVTQAARDISTGESLREVSHRVWRTSDHDTAPRLRWSVVVRTAVLHNPYPGTAVALLWSVSAIGSVVAAIGLVRGLMQVLLSAFALWWTYRAARCLRPRSDLLGIAWFVVIMAVAVIITGPLASMVFDDRPAGSGTGLILANTVWLPTLTILVSIGIGALRSSEAIMTDLQHKIVDEEVAAAAAEAERRRIQKDVAEAIHGISSRITTAQALDLTDVDLSDLARGTPDARAPHDVLAGVIAPWSSLMEVSSHIDDVSPEQAVSIKRVIQEGLANAYRHGHATSCVVEVASCDGVVLVTVTDNGRGLSQPLRPGLGSAVLDAATEGQWSLEPAPAGGCVLRARLP